jgi:Pro-kumamolisin, activation domain/Bacterial Ig-like domain (group 3)
MTRIRVSLASTRRWNIRSVNSLLSLALPAGCAFLLLLLCAFDASAQQPAPRLTGEISNASRSTIAGSRPPATRSMRDAGRVSSDTPLQGMSIVLSRTPAQEADLQSLIAVQQNRSSTQYHQWLTPDQFATRFGVADTDIAQVEAWLQQQGFAVEGVSRSKNRIAFSGTVGQAEAAFGTEIHNYTSGTETHFAPSTDISIPSALAPVVQTVTNLSSFRPKPHLRVSPTRANPQPNFTSGQSGSYFLTPGDVATIYDINASYNSGYTGTGQSIAVAGQSNILQSDVTNFQNAAGLPVKDPTMVLVPNSGSSTTYSGDEAESDLDVEYSGAIGKGASIYFIFVGNNQNYSVWDSIQYAVDTRIAPIISTSYGDCETDMSSSDYTSLNGILAQAAAQGQSVVAAAGDSGSTDCYGITTLSSSQQMALAVDFPASSQYVTGMGGTEFPTADVTVGNTTYWAQAVGSDVTTSALSYIPEQIWNDDTTCVQFVSSGGFPLCSGGGGVSTLTPRPSWQTGVPGIPSGTYRLVPDISLDASPINAPYLFCSSDSQGTGINGSCSNGFRDSNNQYLTTAGGTSFDAPIFAGMLSIVNQKTNSTGQGVINSTLYSLASNATTYASAFHDVTSGNNECTAGSTYCNSTGSSAYAATTGYDEASGLGSLDFNQLLNAWPTTSASTLVSSTTTLTSASATPTVGASDVITITVVPAVASSTAIQGTPTGSVTIQVDGSSQGSSITLSGGIATYSFSSSTSGSHVVQATYSGDATYAGSTGSIVLNVGGSSGSGSGTFTLSATNLSIAQGSSGSSTITLTPQSGYTGTVAWTLSTDSTALATACYTSIPSTTVSGTAAVTASLTIDTNPSDCATAQYTGTTGKLRLVGAPTARNMPPNPFGAPAAAITFAALLCGGLFRRRSRALRLLCAVAFLTGLGLTLSGCSSATSSSSVPKGTYTIYISGADTASSSIAATTSMTLTVN